MAVSAFKSTTRRRGIQVTPNDQESVGPPRTSSDHLTAHHHKLKYHRRSSSFTDVSPYSRHAGESPRFRAPRALKFLNRQLSESDLGKNKPIDDIDGTAYVPKHAEEAIHRLGPPQVIHEDSAMRPVMRRSIGGGHDKYHIDHPEGQANIQADNATRPVLQRSVSGHYKNHRDHPEGQVEEKIIQAVHAQNKPKRTDSLPRDQSELYNIIKAEVFDVVADMKDALENSHEKALLLDDSACESTDKSNTSFSEEIVKVFRYVCKGYAAKIDEAQKEVKQLRSQLAEKEKVCLDLTNLINEMIPESGALQRPLEKLLKEDKGRQIFRYVPEWGKGASQPPTRSGSILDDDARVRRLSSQQILLELEKEAQQGRWTTQSKSGITENKDGLVLPWLQWEEATVQRHLNKDMVEKKQETVQCHLNKDMLEKKQECTLLHSSQEEVSFTQKKPRCDEEPVSDGMHHTHWRKDNCLTVSESSKYTRSSSIKSSHVADSSMLYIKSTELISERIQFRARVEAGELLLCIGTLHIF